MPNDNAQNQPGGLLGIIAGIPVLPLVAFIGAASVMFYQVEDLGDKFSRLDRDTTTIMMRLAGADALATEFKGQISDGISRLTTRLDGLAKDTRSENRELQERLHAIELELARLTNQREHGR